jgi:DNA-binding CsgD family transcriptional regulator
MCPALNPSPLLVDPDTTPPGRVIPLRSGEGSAGAATANPSRQLDTVWRTCFDALLVVDDTQRVRRANGATAELFAAPVDAILGRPISDFTPPDLQPRRDKLWAELMRRGTVAGPYELLCGDGSRSLIEFRATRDFAPGEHLLLAREITAGLAARAKARDPDAARGRLTAREREILQLAADGGTSQAIAAILVVSVGTVKTHFEHIYAKLGVRDRASAVAVGIRRGLIQ